MVQSSRTHFEREECEYDSLTGIYNLGAFKECVGKFFELENEQSRYALLYTNISHFERINNLYGNRMADLLLVELAEAISNISFGLKFYCRSVADHFLMLVDFSDKEKLEHDLDRFCREFNGLAMERFPEAVPRLGIGAYIIYDRREPIDEMVEKANAARKSLREKHSMLVSYYNFEDVGRHRKEKEIEQDMYRALENGEFKVYLQPKYDLYTKKMVGAEALVRWIKEDGSRVYPDEFIPVFERNGFIRQLDFYMLEHVCEMLRRRISEGKRCLPISVNQSRVLLNSDTYTTDVALVLNNYDTPPNLIELELTERIFSDSLDEMAEMMSVLKKLGIKWSIDDFGTGYSSLNLLKKLPVDIIKIDKAFLDETETSNVSKIIIRKTVELTQELDKMVVCEGVETEAQADYLKEIHCDVAQGYLYAKPMPMDEFEKIMDSQEVVA